MSEPLRHASLTEGSSGAEDEAAREARIEQLLLDGLDQYFAGHHDQAIDIWSRVAFLERRHGRARAYIERARSALAERQRESEESLHRGIAAYHAGDVAGARDLLTRAIEQGGPTDMALAFLQRLGRLEVPVVRAETGTAAPGPSVEPAPGGTAWLATALASAAIVAVVTLVTLPLRSFLADVPVAVGAVETAPEPLPVPQPSEHLLERARALEAGGRPAEALAVLAGIRPGDALAPEADRLRATLQRAVLTAVEPGTAARGAAPEVGR